MNRQEHFKKLAEEWLELDLPKTCTSLDMYVSIRIERKGDAVIFTQVKAGKELELAKAQIDASNKVTGMVYVTSTPALGLVLFGLERAVEDN